MPQDNIDALSKAVMTRKRCMLVQKSLFDVIGEPVARASYSIVQDVVVLLGLVTIAWITC